MFFLVSHPSNEINKAKKKKKGERCKAHRLRSFGDTRRNLKRRFVVGGSVGHVVVLEMGH